jgi:hypothetical protein
MFYPTTILPISQACPQNLFPLIKKHSLLVAILGYKIQLQAFELLAEDSLFFPFRMILGDIALFEIQHLMPFCGVMIECLYALTPLFFMKTERLT